jgi:glutamine amidotransferase
MSSPPDVAVIDYGVGNLLSVRRAFERCGASVTVTSDPERILEASRVVLPGVGAFADGMASLIAAGLDGVVREVASRRTPLLGICLGMQMLMDASEEFGCTDGLGLIPGRVVPVPATGADGGSQKIPHIGWSSLVPAAGGRDWARTVLDGTPAGAAVYFVHSFMANPIEPQHRIANCLYGGVPVSAVIGRDNVYGCQFHPEKSGVVGLNILTRFLA